MNLTMALGGNLAVACVASVFVGFRGIGSRSNFARAKYHSGSVPWSFFAPQSYGKACYAG